MENDVINYSPWCRSKPVRPPFIFWTQIKIFLCVHDSTWRMRHHVLASLYCHERNVHKRNSREGKCGIKSLFLFSLHKKYSRGFIKLQLTDWCHMDYFVDHLGTFLDLDRVRTLLSMGGSESSQIPTKISSFVFQRWTEVLRVWNNIRVSN